MTSLRTNLRVPLVMSCEGQGVSLCEGRRHVSWGLRSPIRANGEVAAWLARAAANEAGSIHSFRALARELRLHGIDGRWSKRLRKAARDEVRHTRLLESAARLRAATRPHQEFGKANDQRSLLEIALENVREGCVFETYAALVLAHQARCAHDFTLRLIFQEIAKDELDHAELAWDLHHMLLDRLTPDERRLVREELDRSLRALVNTTSRTLPSTKTVLGLPTEDQESRYRADLARALAERAALGVPLTLTA